MNIASRIKNILFKNQSSGSSNPEQWLVDSLLGGIASSSGVNVSKTNVMGVSTAYACVNILSKTIATLPARLYRMTDDKTVIARSHHLHDLISNSPNSEMTSVDFRRAMQANLSLHNNAYAKVGTNGAGKVTSLTPIHPAFVEKTRNDAGEIIYKLSGPWQHHRTLQRDEMLHLHNMSFDGLIGVDLITQMKDVFGLARALELNAAKFFANGSRPSAFLQTDATLSEPAQKRLRDAIKSHQGVENSNKVMVLEEGLKMVIARSNNRDSQFDESRARQALEICRLFGVQPHKVGILENATYSNIEEQQIDFVSDTIMPIAVTWEQALNHVLLTSRERAQGYKFKIDLRGLLRGKMAERAEYYSKLINAGVMSPNEARKLEDLDPKDGLDVHLLPLNTERHDKTTEE